MAAAEDDIKGLDDPALIAERRRVRDLIDGGPADAGAAGAVALLARWRRLDDEFIARARAAWAAATPGA
jgi:hypothetical protein